MDSYLAIISLALAVAALVPILISSTLIRFWTVTVAALSFVVLIAIYQTYGVYKEEKEVRAVEEEIWGLLTKNEKGMTFDQIYDSLYYPSFPTANAAIDTLVAEDRVLDEKKEVTDTEGTKYLVRKFYRRFD